MKSTRVTKRNIEDLAMRVLAYVRHHQPAHITEWAARELKIACARCQQQERA